jgi:hypothetical protein
VSDEGGTGDEERSQWRIAPSDPPETRTGWNGCHVTATELKRLNFESAFDQRELMDIRNVQQTSFLWPLSVWTSLMARISKTRTVWSLEALATMFPFGDHASACIVFLW